MTSLRLLSALPRGAAPPPSPPRYVKAFAAAVVALLVVGTAQASPGTDVGASQPFVRGDGTRGGAGAVFSWIAFHDLGSPLDSAVVSVSAFRGSRACCHLLRSLIHLTCAPTSLAAADSGEFPFLGAARGGQRGVGGAAGHVVAAPRASDGAISPDTRFERHWGSTPTRQRFRAEAEEYLPSDDFTFEAR